LLSLSARTVPRLRYYTIVRLVKNLPQGQGKALPFGPQFGHADLEVRCDTENDVRCNLSDFVVQSN